MLTGTRPFQGEDIAETLAEVIKGAPDWKAFLPAETPAPVDRLLRGCLEKDRKRRVADASTIRFALDEPPAPIVTTAAAVSNRNRFGPAAVSVALAGLLVIAAVVWSRTTSEVQIAAPVAKFVVEAPKGFALAAVRSSPFRLTAPHRVWQHPAVLSAQRRRFAVTANSRHRG